MSRWTTWCVLLVLSMCLPVAARAQISPGPLSAAHSSLDGPLNCTKCHAGGKKESMTSRCLECHKEIAWLQQQNRGVHARDGRGECSSCHPDHAGKDFALIKWPDAGGSKNFNHARTGWPLQEKHARVACEKCHTSTLRVGAAATLGPKRSTPGWLGLETNCASCHEDVHKGSLGKQCESCHTAAGWSPASKFDHARSSYPLTGKHADVACEKCHTTPAGRSDAKPVPVFKPLAHTDCASCHRDPHAGRLTGACSSCHSTTSFTAVAGKAFSHEKTRYPLRGRHASVSCAACHTGYPARIDQPKFATCSGCHADPHRGQATLAGKATDCASCHTVSGFTPSTFTVAQHASAAFPLAGKHATVACASCHTRHPTGRGSEREVVMRPAADRCESCHADPHAGQIATSAVGGGCGTCHTPVAWKPATFGVAGHAALHDVTCDACHRDPHGGRYAATTTNAAAAPTSCAACHDTRTFRPSTVGAEAHARFSFALEGAHRAAPCVSCHKTMSVAASAGSSLKLSPASNVVPAAYTISNKTCAGCHGTPHGEQFAGRPGGGACESCHDLNGWSPASRFVHDANGGFVLGAAHARVQCAKCHTLPAGADAAAGNAARTWHGVPRSCESCHRAGVPPT